MWVLDFIPLPKLCKLSLHLCDTVKYELQYLFCSFWVKSFELFSFKIYRTLGFIFHVILSGFKWTILQILLVLKNCTSHKVIYLWMSLIHVFYANTLSYIHAFYHKLYTGRRKKIVHHNHTSAPICQMKFAINGSFLVALLKLLHFMHFFFLWIFLK